MTDNQKEYEEKKEEKKEEITEGKKEEKKEEIKEGKKEEKKEEKIIFEKSEKLCKHSKEAKLIDNINEGYKIRNSLNNESFYLCLSCEEKLYLMEDIEKHKKEKSHYLYMNFVKKKIFCFECMIEYELKQFNEKNYRIFFQQLKESDIDLPEEAKLLTKEEITEIKYNILVQIFKGKIFKNILFMVGAGISTSAGIPDFRSKTGLFKQLQDKYNLSSPEEFFLLSTFFKNPQYFYEFTKLFDLSKVNATISHKFMNFLAKENLVKYVFTQNIDGLEKKAKIPEDKLIYAHGNFYEGHCPKCKTPVDINKINEAIEKEEIYKCPKCDGPTKPNVVFYGEQLPVRFYEKLEDCKDIDLIIIMGTSLKVQPFASIPYYTPNPYILLFNMEEVGHSSYYKLNNNSLFIKGKTDESVIKFLKDVDMLEKFREFIKTEYNEDLDKLIDIKNIMLNVDDLAKDMKNMSLNEKK